MTEYERFAVASGLEVPRAFRPLRLVRICPDPELVEMLDRGVEAWNAWRDDARDDPRTERPNLFRADLSGRDLSGANLWGADLGQTKLDRAILNRTILAHADLTEASMRGGRFSLCNFEHANCLDADFSGAQIRLSNFDYANLSSARFGGATVSTCSVVGVSAWDVRAEGATMHDLAVTGFGEPCITTDNIGLAQFLHMIITNSELRGVLNEITSKVVLILGRFSPERKHTLDAMRNELRQRGYVPVLFDFDKPYTRDITETVSTLAHMARFIIADITDAKSIPQELMAIVPDLPSVPVQPLLLSSQTEYGMFEHFRRYPWVLDTFVYDSEELLMAALPERVIKPAEAALRVERG